MRGMPENTHTHAPEEGTGSDQPGEGWAMKKLWFRAYTEMVDDEKLRLLAFEDRWHFVALLCCKSGGILDDGSEPELLRRKLAVKLGVQSRELDEIARRLAEVGLVDFDTLQPLNWGSRQFESDSSAERTKRYRENLKKQEVKDTKRHCDVTVTPPETDTETDTEADKKKIGAKPKRFVPPTPKEVQEYCEQRGNNVQPAKFCNFYEAKGWMVGKNKMKDWKAAVRTWEQSEQPTRKRKML